MHPAMHANPSQAPRILILAIILLMPGMLAAQQERGTAVVTAASAAVREKPDPGARVVETLRQDATAEVLAEQAGWLLVRTAAGKTGWVSLQQATIGGPAQGAPPGDASDTQLPTEQTTPPQAAPAATATATAATADGEEDEDEGSGKRLTVGPIAGIVLGTLTGDDAAGDMAARTSYTAGLALRYDFAAVLGMHAELRYARKGGERSTDDGTTTTYRLDYADLALMLDLRLPIHLATPIVCLGGVASYRVNAGYTDASGDHELTGVRRFDPGIIGGVGVVVRLGGVALLLEGLYEAHVWSIDETDDADLRNSAVTVNLGLLF